MSDLMASLMGAHQENGEGHDRERAMPMMPMDPAKLVSRVRPFLVMRLFSDREKAVRKLMEGFFCRFSSGAACKLHLLHRIGHIPVRAFLHLVTVVIRHRALGAPF